MSDKERRGVSISEENNEFLARQDNASALVDDLVTQYRKSGKGRSEAALALQIEQKEGELEDVEGTANRLRSELKQLRALKSEYARKEQTEMEEVREKLANTTKDPDNPAIQQQADNLGMTPQQLLDEL